MKGEMRDDWHQPATKADLSAFATKTDLNAFATKTDLNAFMTKADFSEFRGELRAMFRPILAT